MSIDILTNAKIYIMIRPLKTDLSEKILGDDLYEALERRKVKRKSIVREEIMLKAMAERDQALDVSTKN